MSARRVLLLLGLALLVVGGGAAASYGVSSPAEVRVDGEVLTIRTFAADVAGVLDRLGVEVGDADRVEPAPHTPASDARHIVITRAKAVELHVDGGQQRLETHAETVGEALEEAGVDLSEHDLVDPAVDRALEAGTDISVLRVEVVETTIEHGIEHGEQRRDTDELVEGETAVETEGEDGLRRETYEVTFVDGQETERELVDEEVVREPIDRVVVVGTAPGPVREAQSLLADLGYPVGPVDGIEGPQTQRALCGWRRLEGREVSRQPLQPGELEALRTTTSLPDAAAGRGVTVDNDCQALYYRQDGRWQQVHRASTGSDGLPREGAYRIQRTREGWHTSTLFPAPEPNMYNSLYFHGAIAVHGSNHVPPHPASAGCVRVTPEAADQLFAALGVGDPVRVIGSY